ncbi:MAG: TonB family protein [Candidatus Aureabacteria bacterium]|nr:TonB family protein [Candidatus Auribacterota bacterium]
MEYNFLKSISKRRKVSLLISIIIHIIFFIPPVQISLKNLFKRTSLQPHAAMIRFRFFAPQPQKEIRPSKKELFNELKNKEIPEKKRLSKKDKRLQELIESVESKKKSKALKTIVSNKPVDEKKIAWDYANFIKKAINRHTEYPRDEYEKRIEDSVTISFCIDIDGKLIGVPSISDIHRSRHNNFNKAAVKAVITASSQFPPLPKELKRDSQYFHIDIEFSRID